VLDGSCLRWIRKLAHAETICNTLGQALLDVAQMSDHGFPDMGMRDLGELKHKRRGDVSLLVRGLAKIKQPALGVVIGKALRADATFLSAVLDGRTSKPAPGVSRGESLDKELGSWLTLPLGCSICIRPSRW
jgi:hypothetical protein